jgi:hypothetical protein
MSVPSRTLVVVGAAARSLPRAARPLRDVLHSEVEPVVGDVVLIDLTATA